MDELVGIKKSIGKRMEGSPHEVAPRAGRDHRP